MAAIPRLSTSLPAELPAVEKGTLAEQTVPALAPLSRLKALHEEAEETARLANLLGRTLYAGIVLALGSAAAVAFATTSVSRQMGWLILMFLAIGAVFHAYRHTMAAPFERAALRSFAEDLKAILLYAGFAWGAGAFLALGVAASPIAAIFYSAGMIAALAVLLRSSAPVVYFAIPSAVLCAASSLLGAHVLGAIGVLIAGIAVAAVSRALDPHKEQASAAAAPVGISLA
jgi:hypothetical protein